jgi:hypothetical protein
MPSNRKIAANRYNAQRSTAPRTARAKQRIRRNALRHGLAAAIVNPPEIPAEIARLAQAICGAHAAPAEREQALIIAECELLLLRVRAARVKVLEEMSSNESMQQSSVLSRQDATCCFDQLMRLERYERRACSRRERAIRAFSVLAPRKSFHFLNVTGMRPPPRDREIRLRYSLA